MKIKTFRTRLILSCLLVVFAVFILISTIMLVTEFRANQRNIQDRFASFANLVSAQLGSAIGNMEFISTHTLSDMETVNAMAVLSKEGLKTSEEMNAYQKVQSALTNYSIVASTYHMTFFNRLGYVVQSDRYNFRFDSKSRLSAADWERIDWIDRVENNFGRTVLLPIQQRLFQDEAQQTLMLVRAVRNSRGVIGYLIVETMLEELSDVLSFGAEYSSFLVITSADDRWIYSSDGLSEEIREMLSEQRRIDWSQMGYLSVTSENREAKISVTAVIRRRAVMLGLVYSLLSRAVWGFFVVIIAVIVIYLMSDKLTRPLATLSLQMQATDFDTLNLRVKLKDKRQYQEIETLYSSFESMQGRLRDLIEREVAWKTLQTEQQLQILQTQINPHFMYNTLNMISIMGYDSGNARISEMCQDLSKLLRYSISGKNGNLSTIGSELENLQSYLSLMKVRYSDSCEYEIGMDDAVSMEKIPRLSLQPFVENIFEHAFDVETALVHIHVSAVSDGEWWQIRIEDDGCGMPGEELAEMICEIERELVASPADQVRPGNVSIGIRNTLLRMNLCFNGAFQWRLENRKPGFLVVLRARRKEAMRNESI